MTDILPTNKLLVVTGYIPLPMAPRPPEVYGALGEKLKELKPKVHPFYNVVRETWLYKMVDSMPIIPAVATADNPLKNTFLYHCIQFQKFQWLYEASKLHPWAKTLVWVDYGLAHVPGWSSAGMNSMLERVRRNDFAIPGCWARPAWNGQIDDMNPCWRFCGGLLVVPANKAQKLKNLVQALELIRIGKTGLVSFEVNALARIEQTGKLPLRWYQADHNNQMWDNYK
jgi:hypothetical protein